MDALFGESRRVCAARETSKVYEESLVGTAAELMTHYEEKGVKGEIVVVVEAG